jgi:hypothetical protein
MHPSARLIVQKAGYRRERLPGGTLVLRLTDSRAETIDAWYDDCNKLMSAWEPGRRLRYLHDIRGAERITLQATDRAARVLRRMKYVPVTDGRGAILLSDATLGGLLSSYVQRRPGWQVRVFLEEAEALRWLSE